MAFFFNETKKEPAKPKATSAPRNKGIIPIATLQKMGCAACPRDTSDFPRSPKMKPSGRKAGRVYLLGFEPSLDDDDDNIHWADKAGQVLTSKFGRAFMDSEVRSNFAVQCADKQPAGDVEIACCRGRVVADIEAAQPLIVVTVGDQAMRWAIKFSDSASGLAHRGTVFNAKIGNHACLVVPILYPNFVFKKSYKKSEYELALEHDVRFIKTLAQTEDLPAPLIYDRGYDDGVEIITGSAPGDLQRLEAALQRLKSEPRVGLDIETNGLRPHFLKAPQILTVAIGTFEDTVAFSLDHPLGGWETDGQRRKAWRLFADFLMSSGIKECHNLAMELEWLYYFLGGAVLRQTQWDDTMSMCHTLDERPGTKSLGVQTLIHYGFDLKAQSDLDTGKLWTYQAKRVLRYNGMDTKWTNRLSRTLRPLVAADPKLQLEHDRKVRLAPVLILTEARGLPVDLDFMQKLKDKTQAKIQELEAKMRRTPEVKTFSSRHGTFSPGNSHHVMRLLRDICKRPEVTITDRDGERDTTGAEVLALIPAKEVPSAPLLMEHRELDKIVGTYMNPILERKIVCPDLRLRGKYSSMVAVTGRLNCEDPNLQNFPKRKHKEVRGAIYAPDGYWIAALDYGQIEFRVVGMAAEDPAIIKACWTGYDVHKFWAERLVKLYPGCKDWIVETFGVDWDEKGIKTLRQEMKNKWVFPQLFGSSVKSCAAALHLPEDVTEDLAGEFWDTFKASQKWQERLLQKYEKNLYVECLGGRKRRGPMKKEQIINAPIQGSAQDIILAGMTAVSEMAELRDNMDLHPSLNVHDDLSFWLPDEGLRENIKLIATEMCRPRHSYVNVPLIVEASVGARWHELEEIAVYRSNELFGTPNPYA